MNLSAVPNLKPIRDYDEHDVINFFAPTGELKKGTFVTLSNTNSGNTNILVSGNSTKTPYQSSAGAFGGVPSYGYGVRMDVNWKIKEAVSGDPVLGVLLYDCRETNDYGESFRYRPQFDRHEQQITLPGEASPVLTRGMISTNNYIGSPLAGQGATISGGKLNPQTFNKGTSIAQFLSGPDAQGYCLVWVTAV